MSDVKAEGHIPYLGSIMFLPSKLRESERTKIEVMELTHQPWYDTVVLYGLRLLATPVIVRPLRDKSSG